MTAKTFIPNFDPKYPELINLKLFISWTANLWPWFHKFGLQQQFMTELVAVFFVRHFCCKASRSLRTLKARLCQFYLCYSFRLKDQLMNTEAHKQKGIERNYTLSTTILDATLRILLRPSFTIPTYLLAKIIQPVHLCSLNTSSE